MILFDHNNSSPTMPTFRHAIILASALFSANAFAGPPAYDGQTPMIEIGPLWLDPAMTAQEQTSVAQILVQAHANIVAVYGERMGSPRVVWCKTMECTTFFAGTDGRSHANMGNGTARTGAQYAFNFPARRPGRIELARSPG